MNRIKVIKTEEEYQEALARLSGLMDSAPGSEEESELELLAILIQKYEEQHYPIALPDPIEAIKFRMEQQGLTRKDMIPYFGSQSRVSEVLGRKRPLSLSMIRALHEGLGIPAEVLLQESGKTLDDLVFDPQDFPLKKMLANGYFPGARDLRHLKEDAQEFISRLLSPLDKFSDQMVYCRRSAPPKTSAVGISNGHAKYQADSGSVDMEKDSPSASTNEKALKAWQAKVLLDCRDQEINKKSSKPVSRSFISDIVKLSSFEKGPWFARQVLLDNGIHFIIEPHLPQTYLDGACFKAEDGLPVVALTLRHDRLDNFWFTLVHELVHIHLHLDHENVAFFDDVEHQMTHRCDPMEEEANELTSELLIPMKMWELEKTRFISQVDEDAVVSFAEDLGISPAIAAGRIRWETGDYSIFSDLVGNRKVRPLFA